MRAVSSRIVLVQFSVLLAACATVTPALTLATHDGRRFDTMFEALSTAACGALPDSIRHDREHVGAVLHFDDGRYGFTEGVGRSGMDRVRFATGLLPGSEIVALWHTHGASGGYREFFSPDDAAVVRTTTLPFFLITPSGNLRVLGPADAAGRAPRLGLRIGAIPPRPTLACNATATPPRQAFGEVGSEARLL